MKRGYSRIYFVYGYFEKVSIFLGYVKFKLNVLKWLEIKGKCILILCILIGEK